MTSTLLARGYLVTVDGERRVIPDGWIRVEGDAITAIGASEGVINIEIEAMMLVGAFTGVVGAHLFDNIVVAFVAAFAGGVLIAAVLHGFACFHFRANQVVSGIILNILALGATTFLLMLVLGADVTQTVVKLEPIVIPVLSEIPIVGRALFAQNAVVYLAFLVVPVV